MNRWLWMVLFLSLTGCATMTAWSQLKSEEYKDGARNFSAVVPEGWMRFNMAKYFVMTKDGIVLDQIAVERLPLEKKLEFTKKQYFKDMTLQDLVEIEIDEWKSSPKISNFEVAKNEVSAIGGYDAFRIEYTYIAEGGLRARGIEYGFMHDKWVYRIHYLAAAQHYFKKYRKDFDSFVKTFRLLKA